MKNYLGSIIPGALVVISLIGCGSEPRDPVQSNKQNAKPSPQKPPVAPPEAPFEYEIVDKKETLSKLQFQSVMVFDLMTTNEVAKKATKDDLLQLWKHFEPSFGDCKGAVRLKTPVPGVMFWGVITRVKSDGEWDYSFTINEYGIDAEPYHFVNNIDRSAKNQRSMIVTLPMVNRVCEQLVRRGWNVKIRKEDFFVAKSNKETFQKVSVTLTPESINIDAYGAEGNTFQDTVDVVFAELGIAAELKKKMYTVVGSPKYLKGDGALWDWTIGKVEVTYIRDNGLDSLDATYAH